MKLNKSSVSTSLKNMFSFESNIDLNNDALVLTRKNIVIKNIIFISNLVYTLIFALVSIGEPSNWFLTILCFPLTFLINHTLNKLINNDKENIMKQQIAMYLCCFYMFLSAILIYVRLKTGANKTYFGEIGYILLYYSLIICSFYQDKKLLQSVYKWLIVIITIIHFTLTYNIVFSSAVSNGELTFKAFITSLEFKDILLRTIILLVFMLVLYISVSMSSYMQTERKKELKRRKELEGSFLNIVNNVYKTNIKGKIRTQNEIEDAYLIELMSVKLASLYGESNEFISNLSDFALIHIKANNLGIENLNDIDSLEDINEETIKANKVIERLALERKCEDIIRTHMDGANTDEFTRIMTEKSNLMDDIILLCDMYVSLRGIRSYKRTLNHQTTMNYLKDTFRVYFNPTLFERFLRFEDDFEILYNNYVYKETSNA